MLPCYHVFNFCLAWFFVSTGPVHALHTLELAVDGGVQESGPHWSASTSGTCTPPPTKGVCTFSCRLASLRVAQLDTTAYDSGCKNISWDITGDADTVIRLRVLSKSSLDSGDSVAVSEGAELLAMVTQSQETWVTSDTSNMAITFERSSAKSHVQLELTAYNQTKVTDTMQQLEGRFSAPEQTNATGQPDYALNTEILWNLDLYAYKINFTIEQLDLDAYAGDLLLIGYGSGPWESEPPGLLLTGQFDTRSVHVNGGRAFVYFLSRNHGLPRTPFQISYIAEGINGTTTMPPTTTDRNHPPTPANVDFDLPIFITGIDPHVFLDKSTNETERLQHQLAFYSDIYRHDHNIDVWRPVHTDDVQFSSWTYCNATSGWAIPPKGGCIRVRWYVEMLTRDGDWAFLSPDLRTVILENHAEISQKLGYTVSLTLEEVNKTWFWGVTIIIVPLALVVFIFMFVLYTRTSSSRSEADTDPDADLDERCVVDDVIAGKEVERIFKEVPVDVIEEKDRQLRRAFNEDEYEDYDAELRGRHRRQALQARFSAQLPLKSALKSPKRAPVAVENPAFEPDDAPLEEQAFFPPTSKPAKSEKQKDLLDDLQDIARKEKGLPALELPRVTELVESEPTEAPTVLYSMKKDGTGTMVDKARPGQDIVRVDTMKKGRASDHADGVDGADPFNMAASEEGRRDSVGNLVDYGNRKDSTILLERMTSNGSGDGEEEC